MRSFIGKRNNEILTAVKNLFLENGIASICFDFNGHGESKDLLGNMTVWNELFEEKVIIDYVKFLNHLKNIYILEQP